MFDIGFLEILVVLIIALIVIGPERMPEVARKIGGFMGKMRRFVNSVKQDNQIQETIDDFKQSMNLQEEQKKITNIHEELQKGLNMSWEGMENENFHRPFSGDAVESLEEVQHSSQFNKAPSQPSAPTPAQSTSNASAAPMATHANTPASTATAAPTTATTVKPEATAQTTAQPQSSEPSAKA